MGILNQNGIRYLVTGRNSFRDFFVNVHVFNAKINEDKMTQPAQPIINIAGEKVALGPRDRRYIPLFHKWLNDFDVTHTYGINFKNRTMEAVFASYDHYAKGGADFVDFVILEQSSMQPIGWTSLIEIDNFHRTAKFTIAIGEKSCWDKGYGTEATRLMMDYGFTCLGLHNIWLTVFDYNKRGFRAYKNAGFKEFGRWRQAQRLGTVAYDVIYMDCLATEFEGSILSGLLPD